MGLDGASLPASISVCLWQQLLPSLPSQPSTPWPPCTRQPATSSCTCWHSTPAAPHLSSLFSAGPALPVPTEPGRRALGPGQRGRRCWPQSAASCLLLGAKAAHSAGFRGQCKTLLVCQLFPVKWFHFSLSSLLGGAGLGPNNPENEANLFKDPLCLLYVPPPASAPQAFHCSGIRPIAPHQSPLGDQGQQGLVVCWSDSAGSQKNRAQEMDTQLSSTWAARWNHTRSFEKYLFPDPLLT